MDWVSRKMIPEQGRSGWGQKRGWNWNGLGESQDDPGTYWVLLVEVLSCVHLFAGVGFGRHLTANSELVRSRGIRLSN